MNKKPIVSVIIPTYNRAHLIGRSIQSVLNQTYQDFEIIVVDDGSTDNTEDIIKKFQKKDERIKYIKNEKNKGGSAARNTGIKAARGKYIAFLDSDDEWMKRKLEKQVRNIEKSTISASISYCGFIRSTKEGFQFFCPAKRGNLYYLQLYKAYISPTSAVMVKRKCFDFVGFFDETLPARQDYDMWLRLSKRYLFDYISEPLVKIYDNVGGGNISYNIRARKKGFSIVRKKKVYQLKESNWIIRRKVIAKDYYEGGKYFCGKFDVKYGQKDLFQAIKLWPLNINYWIYFFVSLFGNNIYQSFKNIKKKLFYIIKNKECMNKYSYKIYNKKKVLLIDHTAGIEKYQKKCVELSKFKDIDLTLLAPKVWYENFQKIVLKKSDKKKYKVLSAKCLFKGYENRGFYYDFGLIKVLNKVKPDVICMLEEPFSFFAFQIVFFKNIFSKKSKIIFYSSDNHSWKHHYPYRPKLLYKFIFNYVSKNTDFAMVVNKEVKDILRSKDFNKPIEIFSWGIDIDLFKKISIDEKEKNRRKLGLDRKIVIGYVGRILKIKGIETLMKIVEKNKGDLFHLLLIGEGPDKEYFQKLAEEMNIQNNCSFLGYIEPNDLHNYYGVMDMLILPSFEEFKERFGRVLIEAMACNIPVIGSNTGGIPEVIKDAGLLFEQKNLEDLDKKIHELLHNEKLKENIIFRGKKLLEKKYTWNAFAKKMHKVIFEVIKY